MSKSSENPYLDSIFQLSADQLELLKEAIAIRENKEKYGASDFEELAIQLGRKPSCPYCGEDVNVIKHGINLRTGKQRYFCNNCNQSFGLPTNSIFHSTKKSFDDWANYLTLMSFNVPLEMLEEICGISHPTALLWRKKIFSTVDTYQDKLYLRDRVWIDETYIFDSSIVHEDGYKKKRGLSKDQLCIIVAIDNHKNVFASICGHGKPNKTKIYKALKDHILPGSTIVHDGENTHSYLIEKLNCTIEAYKADTKSKTYLENMALINNLCSWIKHYIYRFTGMRMKNLQSYLNWFVYLYRVKQANEIWPKGPRILRHLLLNEGQFKRKRYQPRLK